MKVRVLRLDERRSSRANAVRPARPAALAVIHARVIAGDEQPRGLAAKDLKDGKGNADELGGNG